MLIKNYRDLHLWQKSMLMVREVYTLVKKLPKDELFGLSNQMRRAAISIPSNIAEGQARISTKDYIRFVSIAKGSRAELDTQLLLCIDLGYLYPNETASAQSLLVEINKMSNILIKNLTDLLATEEKDKKYANQ